VNFLVDTNVLSEPQRKTPSLKVIEWLKSHEAKLYTSVIVVAELAYGIEDLPRGPKRARLEAWLKQTLRLMQGRIISVNTRVALEWGRVAAEAKAIRKRLPFRDSLIAATARRYDFTVATANVRDFDLRGVRVVNPFA
jgi:predicted nucleic acid-binding protein